MENKNPNNDDLIATAYAASKSVVDEAYKVSAKSQKTWKKVSPLKKRKITGGVEGNVLKPVVFTDVTSDMKFIQEEFFAPVVSILKVSSDKEAVDVANNSNYGLSGALHTRDVERGTELAKQVYTGMIHINDGTIDDVPTVAFGGVKNSGIGRLNGKWSLDAFTTTQWISIQHKARQYPYS